MATIEKKEYEFDGLLQNEEYAVEELEERFKSESSQYVCDAIAEIGDSFIPIYTAEIWEKAYDISEYIEQAISDGLVDMHNFDLVKAFQAGYYEYYTKVLYENFEAVAYNAVVNDINSYLNDSDKEYDLDAIESAIESGLESFDNSSIIFYYKDTVKTIIEQIEDGEYNN